jgi:N6-L-threonylcarbamoyladenine synthase
MLLDKNGAERVADFPRQRAVALGRDGVVPEIAARPHLALLPELVQNTMAEAGIGFGNLGAVAATAGPGLIVGSRMAKGIALSAGVPFVAVNHLEETHSHHWLAPGSASGRF